MARISRRINKDRSVTYDIRVSCGYDAEDAQITKSTSWRVPDNMSEAKAKKEIQRIADEFERSIKSGGAPDMTSIKLKDFIKEYLILVKPKLAPLTHSYYERTLDDLINPALGHLKVKDVRPVHVQKFVEMLQSMDVAKGKKKTTLAPSSVCRYFTVLKSVFAMATRLGYCVTNPTVTDKITLPKVEEADIEIFNEVTASAMLEALETEPVMWRLLINIAVITGARRGEICALSWSNVDLSKNQIKIAGSNYKLKGEDTQTKRPKTKKSVRTVSFDDYCGSLFKEWRKEQLLQKIKLGDQWHEGGWVFTQWNGEPINPTTPTSWFREFQERHMIPHHKFHALRHTSGTLLLSRGANIKTVASRLGHTQLSTVNRYVHALEDADRAAADSLGSIRKVKNEDKKTG